MDDILALRIFLAIAATGSFTKAAERLALTTAFASRKMAALEAALGQRLFQRTTRRVSLTEEGALLQQHAQHIIDTLGEAAEALQGFKTRPTGRLRVLVRAGLGRHFVVPWLPEFRARYPDLQVGLQLVEELMSDLVSSGCDVGMTIGQLHDTTLIARRIAETDSHIYASPEYLARRGVPEVPEALAGHDCLTLAATTGLTTWSLSRGRHRHDVAIRAPVAINDPDALISCACAGLGLLMIADWMARPLVGSGRLVKVLCDYRVEPRGTPINVLYQSRSYVPLKVRAFIEFYAEKALQQFGPLEDKPGGA